MRGLGERLAAGLLIALAALLPFEPRPPALRVLALQFTLLEAVAALALLAGALAFARPLRALARQRPWPLLALTAYAAVALLASAVAEPPRTPPLKFALRMTAMAASAWVVGAAPARVRGRSLAAFVAAGTAVALLAIGEGAGWRSLDGFLDLFRENAFSVSGVRRATAGSEYPNLAAALLTATLLGWAGLSGSARPAASFAVSGLVSAGLLFTYSRGALLAAFVSLIALLLLGRGRIPLRGPATALAALTLATGCFALAGEAFRARLPGAGTRSWYAASYAPEEPMPALRPGEARRVRVRVTNSGRKAWPRSEPFRLSYHWFDVERKTLADGGRYGLARDLAPGESELVDALVVAPAREGRYLLVWDMLRGTSSWFSGLGAAPLSEDVLVGGPGPAPPGPGGLAGGPGWQAQRTELWKAGVLMWRERPLLGVGPDNFRWLYGRYLGQPYWDTRVFANNTLLEAAATTGSLGLLALLATLFTGLRAAYRRLQAPSYASSAACFAILVGLVVHWLIDYTLAFTGHYLLLGLVLGGVSARPDSASLRT